MVDFTVLLADVLQFVETGVASGIALAKKFQIKLLAFLCTHWALVSLQLFSHRFDLYDFTLITFSAV